MQEYWMIFAALAVVVCTVVKPFRRMLKKLLLILTGPAALAAVNFVGGYVGVPVGVNIWTLLISLTLGLPGVCGLLILRILLNV